MAELMLFANDVLFWDVSFFRGVHVRDLEALSDFMISIYDSTLRGLGEDRMCWIPNKHKGFRVRDFYKILVGNTLLGFPWKSIWKQRFFLE